MAKAAVVHTGLPPLEMLSFQAAADEVNDLGRSVADLFKMGPEPPEREFDLPMSDSAIYRHFRVRR